jgi:hypothetical protein
MKTPTKVFRELLICPLLSSVARAGAARRAT